MQYCKNPQKSILWQDVIDAVENAVDHALSAPTMYQEAVSAFNSVTLWFHGKSNPLKTPSAKQREASNLRLTLGFL